MKITPFSKQQNIVVQELEKELLVYDLKTNKAFCLNETSAIVFQLCDGKRTILEISDAISVKLKTLVSEDYVKLTLHELNRDGLLEDSAEIKTYLNSINRREIVKKIGFASLIALPIVSSVVAPSAAMAASGGFPLLAACSTDPDCASGFCRPCVPFGAFTCSTPNHCCNRLISAGPGTIAHGCASSCVGIGSAECCSGQTITSPSGCGFPDKVTCTCA